MSDVFLKALRFQDRLDEINPERNWTFHAKEEPPPHVIEIIKLHRRGYTNTQICEKLGQPRKLVTEIVYRADCR